MTACHGTNSAASDMQFSFPGMGNRDDDSMILSWVAKNRR